MFLSVCYTSFLFAMHIVPLISFSRYIHPSRHKMIDFVFYCYQIYVPCLLLLIFVGKCYVYEKERKEKKSKRKREESKLAGGIVWAIKLCDLFFFSFSEKLFVVFFLFSFLGLPEPSELSRNMIIIKNNKYHSFFSKGYTTNGFI